MKQNYSTDRKIDPTQGEYLRDESPNNCNRVEIGPTLQQLMNGKMLD